MKQVLAGTTLIALVVDATTHDDGVLTMSDIAWPLQAVLMARKSGYVVAKHTHKPLNRETQRVGKAVVVMSGRLRVTFCDYFGEVIEIHEIGSNSCVLLVEGGYTIEVLDDARFFEFKNGPFQDDKVLL